MEYKLIPLNEISDKARQIAVDWVENFKPIGFDIRQKHKLASDIMNYAIQENRMQLSELSRLKGEYQGTLLGISAWNIPTELREKLNVIIEKLENE